MMSMDEMCKNALEAIKSVDGVGIGEIRDLPDYIAFSCKAEGYGFPVVYFPKDGGRPFFEFPFFMDDRNMTTDETPFIIIPAAYA